MSEIHYFPRYSQAENFVTNNTLLLLLRLYQYNRFSFERFMEALCAEQDVQLENSWLRFQQQKTTAGKTVVDGFIAQDSIKIAVETKLNEFFDPQQLEGHLGVFGLEQHKLLILLSPSLATSRREIEVIRERAAARDIQVLHTSFENVVEKAKSSLSEHDEEMLALVGDYESFCSEMRLLPRDEYTLFVPPCGRSFDENREFRLYYCPESYGRRSARYLGLYRQKAVRAIGEIVKVVACTVSVDDRTVAVAMDSPMLDEDERQRILGATTRARARGWDLSTGHDFYLCGVLEETDFRKESPGGIWGRRYLDLKETLGAKIPSNVNDLAADLRNRTWK